MKLFRRLSVLGAAVAVAGLLAPAGTATAAAASVTLSGVVNGGTVSGAVALTATGNAGGGDNADEINFFVDGKSADLEFCTTVSPACAKTYTWDSTGLTGPHTLQAQLKTENGVTVSSPVNTVTVLSPAPTMTLTSPASGALVSQGSVAIAAVGAVNSSQVDTGSFGTLLVDGQSTDTKSCPTPAAQTCALTFSWDTTFTTGPHTLQASFETTKGVIVSSAPITLTVHVPTKSMIGPIDGVAYGKRVVIEGQLSSTAGHPLVGVTVTVVVKSATGKTVTKSLVTDEEGDWRLSYKATANASVVASEPESPSWGASHASIRLPVFVTGHCVTKELVHAGAAAVMTCTKVSPSLKKAKVQLQILKHGKWHTFASAKVSGTKFRVPYRLAAKGTAQVRVLLPANKFLTDSATSTFFIAVV